MWADALKCLGVLIVVVLVFFLLVYPALFVSGVADEHNREGNVEGDPRRE